MGLDAVELVMEIEEAFSIKIPDDEASRMVTVGDVFDYIVTKTSVPINSSVCLSAATFYSIRRAAAALGASKRLRPQDETSTIIPQSNGPEFWTQLQNNSKLRLPRLRRPDWLVKTCALLVVGCSVLPGTVAYQSTDSKLGGIAAAITGGILLGGIAWAATQRYAVLPDSNCVTLRGLAESTMGMNFETLSERYHGAYSHDLWIALRSIIVEQLDVSSDEVKPTASFVNDLGCG